MRAWMIAMVLGAAILARAPMRAEQASPAVTAPPDAFFEWVDARDREAAGAFYTKYVDIEGMPVVAETSSAAARRGCPVALSIQGRNHRHAPHQATSSGITRAGSTPVSRWSRP